MSWTKNGAIRCDGCGLFCQPVDSFNVFGQASYDPPEPFDPEDFCLRCAYELYLKWNKHFANGGRSGDWQKSKAEAWAAEKYGLVWIHSNGVGTYGTDTDSGIYRYIPKADYERLSKLPRYQEKKHTPETLSSQSSSRRKDGSDVK